MSDPSPFEDPPAQTGSKLTGCLIQAVTHGIALVGGVVIGILGLQVYEYVANPEMMSKPEADLSRAELLQRLEESERAYATLLAETRRVDEEQTAQLADANKKVTTLETEVAAKEKEVEDLQAKAQKGAVKSAALKKELADKTAELEALRAELTAAKVEQERLKKDLEVSRAETAQARQETQVARGQTVDARWDGFRADVLLQVCEKGNRNKLSQCREEIGAALNSQRAAKYKHCLKSNQASPRLVKVDDKARDVSLPAYSEWLDQESKFSEGEFYLTFCDPTLPEATAVEGDDPLGDDPL